VSRMELNLYFTVAMAIAVMRVSDGVSDGVSEGVSSR
jgi:hypothetical protein